MKILKWNQFDCEAKDLIIGKNFLISVGQYEGLSFNIQGLGLSKFERKVFGAKLFQRSNIINIYLGKLIITHDKKGYKKHLSNVDIIYEMELKEYIKNYINHSIKPKLQDKFNKLISKLSKKFLFRKKEIFIIQQHYERPKKIKCDRLTAFQLASNYEADLLQSGTYLLSPLGFEWKENKELIVKHLGKSFNNFKLYGYSDWSDVEIIE